MDHGHCIGAGLRSMSLLITDVAPFTKKKGAVVSFVVGWLCGVGRIKRHEQHPWTPRPCLVDRNLKTKMKPNTVLKLHSGFESCVVYTARISAS